MLFATLSRSGVGVPQCTAFNARSGNGAVFCHQLFRFVTGFRAAGTRSSIWSDYPQNEKRPQILRPDVLFFSSWWLDVNILDLFHNLCRTQQT